VLWDIHLCQLERHVNECCVVYRLPIAERRLETNAFGNVPCLFIEPMAEAIDNANHLDLTAGEETHLEGDFPLDPCFLRLGGVARLRLGDHDRRSECRLSSLRHLHMGRAAHRGAKLALAT